MAVVSIEFAEEVDNRPDADSYGDYPTYHNYLIYKLINDDGSEQFIKVAVNHDSYGASNGISRDAVTLAELTTKTVVVWT